jgi:hypothetical protein
MPITTDVVSSDLDQFVSDLQQVGSFVRVLAVKYEKYI